MPTKTKRAKKPLEGNELCTCGHMKHEHGDDPELPGSSACNVEDCDCVCWDEE